MTTSLATAFWGDIWGIVPYALTIVGNFFVIAAIVHMLRYQRSPSGAIAWLFTIVMLPQVGVPLYIMLGGRKALRRARRKGIIKMSRHDTWQGAAASRVHRVLVKQGIPGASAHNRVRLLTTPQEGYEGLIDVIESARRTLHVSTFIFGYDDVARDVLQRLCRRASEGVDVRLLVDGLGSIKTGRWFFRPLTAAGGRFAVFSPIINVPLKRRANLRNHRKIAIADGRRVMSGGMNIYRAEMCPEPAADSWIDLSFLLEGRHAGVYEEIFRSDWSYACGEDLPIHAEATHIESDMKAVTQTVPSGPDVSGDPLYEAIMTCVYDACHRLWLVTPYFVPDEALAQALRIACNRGVDVRILVPKRSNHFLADIARASFLRDILQAGGNVRFYEDGMVHAKALLMDDHVAMIGSANFDMRSLFLNYEVMQVFYSRPEIAALHHWMERLDRLSISGIEPRGMTRELVEGVARMAAPLL